MKYLINLNSNFLKLLCVHIHKSCTTLSFNMLVIEIVQTQPTNLKMSRYFLNISFQILLELILKSELVNKLKFTIHCQKVLLPTITAVLYNNIMNRSVKFYNIWYFYVCPSTFLFSKKLTVKIHLRIFKTFFYKNCIKAVILKNTDKIFWLCFFPKMY